MVIAPELLPVQDIDVVVLLLHLVHNGIQILKARHGYFRVISLLRKSNNRSRIRDVVAYK